MDQSEPKIDKQPDWKIEDLYRDAWSIVKKNKILWIFASALGAGSSFNSNFKFNDSDSKSFQEIFKNFESKPQLNEVNDVLGAATSSVSDFLGSIFSAVPVWLYILLIVEFVVLILIGSIITLIYYSWAEGALLENINKIILGGKADIQEASKKALSYVKRLLFVGIVPGLLLTLIVFAIFGLLVFLSFITEMYILMGILGFIFLIAVVYAYTLLTFTLIWAPRKIVSENVSYKVALVSAYKIAKRKFWSTFLLGIINNIVAFVVFIVPSVVLAFLFGGGFAAGYFVEELRIPLIILGGLLIIVVMLLFTVGSAVLGAFKTTVWSLAFSKIKNKYE